MAKKHEVKYQIVVPEQFKEAIEFYNNTFLTDEPTLNCGSHGSNHPQADIDRIDLVILGNLKHNLSWCAVDADTGKIVGLRVAYAESLTDPPDAPLTSDQYVEKGFSRHVACCLAAASLMLEYMHKKMLTSYQESKILGLFGVCVHSEYRKEGIASELVRRNLDHAAKLGFTLTGEICTSVYSQKIFEKQGFEKLQEEYYASYVDASTKLAVFENVDKTHPSVISYIKKLC